MKQKKHLYHASRIESLESALGKLEGRSFGPWLVYSVHYQGLMFSGNSGWEEIQGFSECPELSKFAKDLNAATAPVIEEYARKLRQEIANCCVKMAADALSDGDA